MADTVRTTPLTCPRCDEPFVRQDLVEVPENEPFTWWDVYACGTRLEVNGMFAIDRSERCVRLTLTWHALRYREAANSLRLEYQQLAHTADTQRREFVSLQSRIRRMECAIDEAAAALDQAYRERGPMATLHLVADMLRESREPGP